MVKEAVDRFKTTGGCKMEKQALTFAEGAIERFGLGKRVEVAAFKDAIEETKDQLQIWNVSDRGVWTPLVRELFLNVLLYRDGSAVVFVRYPWGDVGASWDVVHHSWDYVNVVAIKDYESDVASRSAGYKALGFNLEVDHWFE